jgi:hypothetical protein
MFVTPLVAALLIGSFWTGVGTAAVVSHNGGPFAPPARSDVVITAEPSDHDAACAAKYRSYNIDTGQYLSKRDRRWHDCEL